MSVPDTSWPLKWEKNASFQDSLAPQPPPGPHPANTTGLSPGTPLSAPRPKGCWICTRNHGAGCMQRQRRALLPGQGRRLLPSRSRTGLAAAPHPKQDDTWKGANRNRGEPPGLEEEGRGSPKGKGARLRNASGPGRGRWSGKAEEEMRVGRALEGEEEQSCSLGQIFCGFIRFSVNRLVFARTGRRGESKRARARRERSERASPAARVFTSQSSSVQTLHS